MEPLRNVVGYYGAVTGHYRSVTGVLWNTIRDVKERYRTLQSVSGHYGTLRKHYGVLWTMGK